jgi:hypothetical protein
VAAARLADVGAGDSLPPVGGGVGKHPLQGLAVAGLQLGTAGKRATRLGDPRGKGVTDPFQFAEPGDPRLCGAGRDRDVDFNPRKGLGEEAGQLALETADLTPQLGARQALVAPDAERREGFPFE